MARKKLKRAGQQAAATEAVPARSAGGAAAPSVGEKVLAAAAVAVLGLAAVLQGGYFEDVSAAIGLGFTALAVGALVVGRGSGAHGQRRLKPSAPLCLAALGVAGMLALVVFCSPSYSQVAGVAPWAVLAASLAAGELLPARSRGVVLRLVGWLGAAVAAVSLCVYTGAFEAAGFLAAGRLNSFFQYANTAGVWFGAVALVGLACGNGYLKAAATLPLTCLLLTKSAGATLVFAVGAALFCALAWARGNRRATVDVALAVVAAGVAGAVVLAIPWASLAVAAAARAFVAWLQAGVFEAPAFGERLSRVSGRAVAAVALAACALAAAAVAVFFADRAAQASQTFVERLIQAHDGVALLAQNPLTGAGPNQWRNLYLYTQTAQYTANVIHNGWLQVLLDGGVVAGGLIVVALAWGLVRSVRRAVCLPSGDKPAAVRAAGEKPAAACDDLAVAVAALMLLAHATLDIDLRFAAVTGLLGLLLGMGARPTGTAGVEGAEGLLAGARRSFAVALAASLVVAGACSAAALVAAVAKDGALSTLAAAGPADAAAAETTASGAFAATDADIQAAYLAFCARTGNAEAAEEHAAAFGLPRTSAQAQALAEAYYAADRGADAEHVLLDELERAPYGYRFFGTVADEFADHGASQKAREHYNELAARANGLIANGSAALLANQQRVEPLG